MSYLCNRCSGWVHSKCSGLQNAAEYRRIKDWVCSSCNSPHTLPKLQPPPIPTQAVDENSFTIMQFNANGIGNKLTELGEFLKRHNVKVVVIQESKLSSNSKTPSIQNFTTVRKDRRQGQGGGLLTLIHKSINFSRKPESPETLVEPHLEELTITATLGDTELIITNVYIPPASSCTGGYLPSLDHLMMTTDTQILGDFNAHHSAWYSSSTDTRGTLLENVVSGSNFGILNWDSPTRLPGNANPSSPDVSLASASLITSTNWQTKTNLGSDHLPILISLQMDYTINPIPHRISFNLKKANWDRYSREIEDKLSKRRLPSNCQKGEKILRTIILKAASRHIPSGRHRINTEPVPAEILEKMRARDDLRSRDPTSPGNDEITRTTNEHRRNTWRQFVETLDHRTDPSKLWRTIKAIDGKSPPKAENEAITFGDIQVSSPKQISNYFNRQFTTSKLGRHTSSRETRIVSREIKRKSLMSAVTFTTDQVIKGISNCSNTKAFGPDKFSIFHLKNLGPRAIEYLTAIINDSVTSCRIPAIWKSSIVIPIPKPGKDSSLGTSYRPISLLCPAAKVMEALILTTVNTHLLPASDQHGFRTGHSTTSALLQLTSDVATGFNQRKPPHRPVCVAVDLTAAFDTVNHNALLSKIARSTLPGATCRWLSNYIRGRQSVTSSRGVKSKARIIHTGVPQGSKLSPTLFSFYIADMPRPTAPVKRICYPDDITVWASGVEITELEHKVNTYLTEMSRFLQENSLLISAPKSSVTLFTPDPAQANTRPKIKIADSEIPLVRSPKLLGVYLDTFFSFNKHCVQVANRVSKRNNVLKALAGTNWGQQKETLLMTYKALGRSIANYAAPVWSINASETNIGNIQRAQNEALRIITGSHKMSSIDHIHSETKMLQVEDHLNLLSAQYLVQCLDTENVCHHITKMDLPPREMKETIFTRHYQTVLPLLANNRKDTLQALHTSFVNTAIGNMKDNRVLNSRPPSINDEETLLQRRQRTTLSQLRSGHCKLLNSYKKRLKQSDSSRCPDCGMDPQDVPHLFDCVAHPNDLSPVNLWDKPIETIRELSFLDPGNLN